MRLHALRSGAISSQCLLLISAAWRCRFACHSSPYRTVLGRRSSFIRTTWPVQVSCRLRSIVSMLGISARYSTSLLVTWTNHLIPRMARKWRRCICDNCNVYVSELYRRHDGMIARHTLHFVTSLMLCLFHNRSRSAYSYLSRLQSFAKVLRMYLKVVARLSGVPLSKIVGAVYGVPGAGWCKTSVSRTLIESKRCRSGGKPVKYRL